MIFLRISACRPCSIGLRSLQCAMAASSSLLVDVELFSSLSPMSLWFAWKPVFSYWPLFEDSLLYPCWRFQGGRLLQDSLYSALVLLLLAALFVPLDVRILCVKPLLSQLFTLLRSQLAQSVLQGEAMHVAVLLRRACCSGILLGSGGGCSSRGLFMNFLLLSLREKVAYKGA